MRTTLACIIVAVLGPAPAPCQNAYVGAKACAPCHGGAGTAPVPGSPFQVWRDGPHAKAVHTLAEKATGKEAKRFEGLWIVKMGRGEAYGLPSPAEQFPHCLVCHSTGEGAAPENRGPSLSVQDGVQCEACHGPGSAHVEVQTWRRGGKPIPPGEIPKAFQAAKAETFRRYSGPASIEEACRKCHDGMCGDFVFRTMWPRIQHGGRNGK